MTRVTSYASHAEGSYTTMPDGTKRYGTASGYASHVEGGGCHAEASCSHSEGLATTTKGNYSHSEGRYTIASSPAQHVEGVANIEDTASTYIHIAGNGDWDARSNAYTLDWNGNAWYAGDVYIGSTSGINKDEGSKKLATEEIVPTNLKNGSSAGSLRGLNTLAEDDSYTIGENAFSIGNGTKASGKNSFASGQNVEATGAYSHAEGYETYATAAAAHAEGYDTHATARYAHAEGASTTASGNNSHAEGNGSVSSGHYSHAEGNFTTAAGDYSHTEGNYAQTGENGTYAHAEGSYTKAMATGAHTEGNYTEANGAFSHTEGYYTKAGSMYQHVRGKYNIADENNVYSTIIGNGDADSNRKNIYTLDWDGNVWFAGDAYVGSTSGTNKDEGSKKLATEEFVETEVAALVGSAPETLDTIEELATALNNNKDIITVLNDSIATKANKTDVYTKAEVDAAIAAAIEAAFANIARAESTSF